MYSQKKTARFTYNSPTIGPPIFLQQNIGRQIVGIYNRTHKLECWNWDCGHAVPFLGIYFSNFRYSIFSVYNVFPNKLRFSGKKPRRNVKRTIPKRESKIRTGFENTMTFFIVTLVIYMLSFTVCFLWSNKQGEKGLITKYGGKTR